MGDPGANVRGTVTLTSTSSDAGSGVATVTYQYSAAGQNTWPTTSALWNTTTLTDGLYDLHAVVTDNAGNSTVSATVANVRVDNTAPAVTMTSPGANVRGTVTLGSTSSDEGSGVSGVVYQYSPAGQGVWTTTPSSWNTVSLADGLYDLRATATDNAGNSTTSVGGHERPRRQHGADDDEQRAVRRAVRRRDRDADRVDAGSGVATTQYKIDGGSFTDGHDGRHRRAARPLERRRPHDPVPLDRQRGQRRVAEVGQRDDRHHSARRNRGRPGLDAARHGHPDGDRDRHRHRLDRLPVPRRRQDPARGRRSAPTRARRGR